MGIEIRTVVKWRIELAQVKPVDRDKLESLGLSGPKVKCEKAGPTRTWGWYRTIEIRVLAKVFMSPFPHFILWHIPVAVKIATKDRRMCGRMKRRAQSREFGRMKALCIFVPLHLCIEGYMISGFVTILSQHCQCLL